MSVSDIRSVGLVAKPGHHESVDYAQKLILWLESRSITVRVEERLGELMKADKVRLMPDARYPEQDLIIVLGGDGTLLHAALRVGLSGVPLLGVNLGSLGFLTEITTAELFPTLDLILAGELRPEGRMRLRVELFRREKTVFEAVVLNDAVLSKGALARIVDLTTTIDGRHLTGYRADGLIISTPTGSTAYNLSAGGPILHPMLTAMIITPICPFTLANRPLVVRADSVLTVELGDGAKDVFLTCDGQEGVAMESGDRLVIGQTDPLRLYPSPTADHYSILRTKLGWGDGGVCSPM